MKKEDIDEKINNGKQLFIVIGIKKDWYYIDNIRITKNQFDSAKDRFKGKLITTSKYNGLTTHYYTINQTINT